MEESREEDRPYVPLKWEIRAHPWRWPLLNELIDRRTLHTTSE